MLPKVLGKNIVIYAFNFSTINFTAISGPTLMSIIREAILRYLGSRRSKRSRITSDGFSTNPWRPTPVVPAFSLDSQAVNISRL